MSKYVKVALIAAGLVVILAGGKLVYDYGSIAPSVNHLQKNNIKPGDKLAIAVVDVPMPAITSFRSIATTNNQNQPETANPQAENTPAPEKEQAMTNPTASGSVQPDSPAATLGQDSSTGNVPNGISRTVTNAQAFLDL